jgi:hypothetical protein
MTLSDLASIGTLISGLAVLASLIYLGLQVRQNTNHSRALIQQGRAARNAEFNLRLAEFDFSDGIDKCFAGDPDVSDRDLRRYLFLTRANVLSFEDSFLQHREGLMEGPAFEHFQRVVQIAMHGHGFRAAWKLMRPTFGSDFGAYMDKLASEAVGRIAPSQLALWKVAIDETAGKASI